MSGLTAVVLVGGQGTRLRPLTENLPKPMLPVLNRPFLEYLLGRLREADVERVILAMGYQPDPLIKHFGVGSHFGLHIEYAIEEEPLGTSGAVRALLPELTETFLVLNGDVISSVDIKTMVARHIEQREYGTLAVHTVDDPSAYGLVVTDGEGYVTQFLEKPNGPRFPARTINSGVYVLEPETLKFVSDGFSMFERDLFPTILMAGIQLQTFQWEGYFSDMGTPESYLALQRDMLEGRVPMPADVSPLRGRDTVIDPAATVEGSVVLGDEVRIGANARVIGPVSLGEGCVIEEGAVVENSVLWNGVHVGPGAVLRGAMLGEDVRIEGGAVLPEGAVLGNGAKFL